MPGRKALRRLPQSIPLEILFNFIHPGQQFHGSGQIPGKAQYLTELDGVVKEHQPFIGHFRRLCFRGQMSLDLLQPGAGPGRDFPP